MENNNPYHLECRNCIFRTSSMPKKTYVQTCTKTKEKIKASQKACELHDTKID